MAAVLVARLADESAIFLPFGALESFRADLGLTYAQAGAVLAAIAPGALVGGVFAAAADRYSRRVISAGGAFGFALALAMFAFGGSFAVLAAGAVLMGMASTAMVDGAEVALVDLAGDDLRRFLARSNLLATVGDLLGPALLAGAVVLGLSWRAAFGVGAVLMTFYALALAGAPLPPPARVADGDEEEGRRPGLVAVLRDPAVWVMGVIGLLMIPFDEPLVGFTVALLEQDRGASPAVATVVAFIGITGGVLAFTVLARRFEAVDDHRLLTGSVAVMAAGAVTIAVVPVLAVVAVAGLVTAIGLSLAWLAMQHRSLLLRPGQVGTTNAVLGAIESTGAWLPLAIGALADRAGLTWAVGSFGIVGAALVVLSWWDGRRNGRLTPARRRRTLSAVDTSAADTRDGGRTFVKDPQAFLPLPSATLHILVALTSGEKHGYAIMGEVEALSDGAVRMGPGTLYGSVKRLLADGLIEESDERPDADLDDQRRRYYRLTGLGERVCAAELQRLQALIRRAGSPEWARRFIPRPGEA